MTEQHEQPLVTWREIAKYLKCCNRVAKDFIEINKIATFKIGRRIAVYPSWIREKLEKK